MTGFQDSLGRVEWPERVVVTAGMPYGNKGLHFGHIGGVFVPADAFARFMRDRIGADRVCFVSGTDCFGSPINEGYRKKVEQEGFTGSIRDYVMLNHDEQKSILERFDISLDIFEGSDIGRSGVVHREVTCAFIERLYKNGWLKRRSTLQFYDTQAQTFLNGRQVIGRRCPVQGCKAEHAYADECDLGHQYDPCDLEEPISTLTGQTPEMRPVENWYFDLPAFADFLRGRLEELKSGPETRPLVSRTIEEFLSPPIIYVKNECYETYRTLKDQLPDHIYRAPESGKASFEIEFSSISDRDRAREVLNQAHLRYRTSKTLVPFRMTGNIDWGIKAPVIEGVEGLTVWCWPESLWAPISFTQVVTSQRAESSSQHVDWADFWCRENASVYQFIGQDNVYFYGVAQPALFEGLNPEGLSLAGVELPLIQTKIVANHHLLFGKTKASSSGDIKPPSGEELLEYYTAEQLRAHFLALGLDQKSVSFCPKPFDPDPAKRADPRVSDPVLKESALLTNVFNRLARSCLYEAKNTFDCCMPLGEVTQNVLLRAQNALRDYDNLMHKVELHSVMSLVDEFIRFANRYWADEIKTATETDDMSLRRQVLLDSFYVLRVCTLLMHPIVPRGCETIGGYLNFSPEKLFSWDYDFESNEELCDDDEVAAGAHHVRELPARFDFFRKHESQYKDK